jgi:amino acid permease
MAVSTAIDLEGAPPRHSASLKETSTGEKGRAASTETETVSVRNVGSADNTHRTLKSRHIQLIGTFSACIS